MERLINIGLLNGFRGEDSTGVYILSRKKGKLRSKLLKKAISPFDFFRDSETCNEMRSNMPCLVLGHARYATHGDVNEQNAQPIQINHLVGTHNGIFPDLVPIKEQLPYRSDSRTFFEYVQKHRLKKALDDHNEKSKMALALYDTNSRQLTFYRNKHRPLFFGIPKKGAILYWSSEREAMEFVFNRDDIEYEIVELPVETIATIEGGTHFSKEKLKFTPANIEKTSTPSHTTFMPSTTPVQYDQKYDFLNRPSVVHHSMMEKDLTNLWADIERKKYAAAAKKNDSNAVAFTPPTTTPLLPKIPPDPMLSGRIMGFIGPRSTRMSYDAARIFFGKRTCDCCNQHIDPVADQVMWWNGFDDDLGFICQACYEDPKTQEQIIQPILELDNDVYLSSGSPIISQSN